MDSIRSALTTIKSLLVWLPDPVVALILLALAGGIALALHRSLRRVVRRLLAERYPRVLAVFTQTRSMSRLALLIIAMIIVIPVAPIDSDTGALLARVLLIGVIALIGWAAIVTLKILAELYLLRFRIDTADNLLARKHFTQIRVLLRTADVLVGIVTVGAALMTFEPVRQYGVSLFASAGVAGIVAGLAARPVLSNLFAGVQLAMTQPIRIDDAVIVEGEWGSIEEITSTYVVVRLWDWRRMIVPLTYFIEKPFQNWTRESSALIGSAYIYLDYRAPIATIRKEFEEIIKASKNWNGQVVNLQVTDAKTDTIELRCLASANSAGMAFDLRCEIREKLIDYIQRELPQALPRQRQINTREDGNEASADVEPAPRKGAVRG
jgi:small-conductance mechanosensitive channel